MPNQSSPSSSPSSQRGRKQSPRQASSQVEKGRPSLLTSDDLYLFNEGTHFRIYEKLGAHPMSHEGVEGTYFAVWAPNAERVSVIGEFNGWQPGLAQLS